jgi:Putative peptidoglycan binding domain
MKTNRMLSLIGAAALSLTVTLASAATHASPMMTRPAMTRPAPRFAARTMTGTHHFRHFRNRTFIFIDTFGFPFFYPYPYYGYYPYDYYSYNDYGYGSGNTIVEVQRRLASAGYYRGPIDGILGPQTRRAIRAYERDHNLQAYGTIDRQVLRTLGLG